MKNNKLKFYIKYIWWLKWYNNILIECDIWLCIVKIHNKLVVKIGN